jgi:hypothetical protein
MQKIQTLLNQRYPQTIILDVGMRHIKVYGPMTLPERDKMLHELETYFRFKNWSFYHMSVRRKPHLLLKF